MLSPMERSRIELTLKVLDVNDPNVVLVDPPKPDWLKEQEAKSEDEDKDKDKDTKKGDVKSDDTSSKDDETENN